MFFKLALLALLVGASLTAAASNEGVFLTNCDELEPGKQYSEMDYYVNAKTGSKPQAIAVVDSSGYINWEGHQVCGYFNSTGETFCCNISSNATSFATGSYAGSGYNNEKSFACYKDNGRTLYTSVGIICKSIYYCFDVPKDVANKKSSWFRFG